MLMRTRVVPSFEMAAKELAGEVVGRILDAVDYAGGEYVRSLESLSEEDVRDCMTAVISYKLSRK